MTSVAIFAISGLAIILLIATKKLGEKRKKYFFISNVISKGDRHTREVYHRVVRLYSEGREQVLFLLNRQLPIRLKNSLNKSTSFLKKKREKYIVNMRDSRLLKKPDGISEFFKNISSIEKGNGEIHEVYEEEKTVLKTPKKR